MKKLAFITLIAAFVIGGNSQSATAAKISDGPSLKVPTGTAKIELNLPENLLHVKMATAGDQERVSVSVLNEQGQALVREEITVDGRGDVLDIDLTVLEPGTYKVVIRSTSIKAAERFTLR